MDTMRYLLLICLCVAGCSRQPRSSRVYCETLKGLPAVEAYLIVGDDRPRQLIVIDRSQATLLAGGTGNISSTDESPMYRLSNGRTLTVDVESDRKTVSIDGVRYAPEDGQVYVVKFSDANTEVLQLSMQLGGCTPQEIFMQASQDEGIHRFLGRDGIGVSP